MKVNENQNGCKSCYKHLCWWFHSKMQNNLYTDKNEVLHKFQTLDTLNTNELLLILLIGVTLLLNIIMVYPENSTPIHKISKKNSPHL